EAGRVPLSGSRNDSPSDASFLGALVPVLGPGRICGHLAEPYRGNTSKQTCYPAANKEFQDMQPQQKRTGPDTSGRRKASDYPQEVLNIFDLYVHGDIDRRGFLDRTKKFAVGGLTGLALLESLQHNYAW